MISIIMPMYNSSKWILETLTSISKQTYANFECIIIDDESVDDSIEVTSQFIINDIRFRLFERPEMLKKGPSSCRNYACSLAKGTFIQFFDSDDVMHPNHLLEKISSINEADFVLCKIHNFEDSFSYDLFNSDTVPNILKFDNLFEAFVCGNFPMLMVAPMWRAEVLKKHLPFNEELHVLEDHELYSRILFETNSYKIINKTLIYYRQSSSSSMNQFYNNLKTGIDSYLAAKKAVLKLSNNSTIKLSILKMVLGVIRSGLAQKEYLEVEKCFDFIKKENLVFNNIIYLKMLRIRGIYQFTKRIGKGDTYLKQMLKL